MRRLAWSIGTILVVSYFFLAKAYLFEHLAYISDLFVSLQLSRSWVETGKFLHENCFGGHIPIHNYFLTPLLYPLTASMGAYGLFLAFYALICLAIVQAGRVVDPRLLPFIFALPVGYWLIDHHTYGFAIELIQTPVAVLLATSLVRNARWQSVLWAGVMMLNKEDGVVLLAAILIAHHWFVHGLRHWSRLLLVISVCVAVFVLGLLFQRSHGGERTADTIEVFLKGLAEPQVLGTWLRGLLVSLVLGLPLLVLLTPKDWRRWLPAFVVGFIPLAIVATLSGSGYKADNWIHGIHWPTRYALIWGFTLAVFIFTVSADRTWRGVGSWVPVFLFIALIQSYTLLLERQYRVWERLAPFAFQYRLPSEALSTPEQAFFRCLSTELSPRIPLATDRVLFRYFTEQDLVWPGHVENALHPPEIFICGMDLSFLLERVCRPSQEELPQTMVRIRHGRWSIVADGIHMPVIEGCITRSGLRVQ